MGSPAASWRRRKKRSREYSRAQQPEIASRARCQQSYPQVALLKRVKGVGTLIALTFSGPLEGEQVDVGRVALHGLTCGPLMPTPAGQVKVDRNVEMSVRLFLGQLY
jgi:hypothetical protein